MTIANAAARVALRQTPNYPSLSRCLVTTRARVGAQTTQSPATATISSSSSSSYFPPSGPTNKSAFHTSTPLLKKGKNSKKSNSEPAEPRGGASSSSSSPSGGESDGGPTPETILDFSPDVDAAIIKQNTYFLEQLRQQRSGGRFNPDSVGELPVHPDRKAQPDLTYPLRDLASVVPKGGRALAILAHEESYIKPILSAVQGSPQFNQQPQRDPDNELCLLLKIEAEPRDEAAKRVKAVCNEWRDRIRAVRHKRDKLHKKWAGDKLLLPDVKVRAGKELDKVIKGWMDKVDVAEKEGLNAAGK